MHEDLIERIIVLMTIEGKGISESQSAREVYMGTLGIATSLYGPASHQVEAIQEISDRITKYNWSEQLKNKQIISELRGSLSTFKDEIEKGLIKSIQLQAKAEVISDFIYFSKMALEDNQKDVASVLACAALEDALKKYATNNELDIEDKEMSTVIDALKSKGLLMSAQSKVLKSFVLVRNKAFHAEWNKIETSEVKSVIGFVEEFIIKRLSPL